MNIIVIKSFVITSYSIHYTKLYDEYRAAIPELSRSMDLLPTKQAAAMLSTSYEAIGDRKNAQKYAEMAK